MPLPERTYSQIVEDVLTHLTGGVVAESHPYDPSGQYELGDSLQKIAKVTLVYAVSADGERREFIPEIDYEFQPATDTTPNRLTFRPEGNKPEAGSTVSVNYYPDGISPLISDRNVGSVARTIAEVFSRETAALYATLKHVYDSAFLDTASGKSLEMLVSILGIRRFRAGYATGVVRFMRSTPAPADITIPVSTVVSDLSDNPVSYIATQEKILRAGQTEVQVPVRATVMGKVAKAKTLVLMPKPVLGIEKVENPEDTTVGTRDETDDELRARARRVIKGSTTATTEAIELALQGIPGLSSVTLVDRPKEVNGRVDIVIDAASGDETALRNKIHEVLSRVKPAGVYVDVAFTEKVWPAYAFEIITDGPLSPDETSAMRTAIEKGIQAYFDALKPGENVLAKRMVAIILSADKVYDVRFSASETGLYKADGNLISGRNLLNGDIYVETSEKVTFKKEYLTLGFPEEEAVTAPESETRQLIFADVAVSVGTVEGGPAFPQIRKIVEGKIRLFFDSLTEEDSYFLKDLRAAADDDSGEKYQIRNDSLTVRAIHSRDGLIVSLSNDNDLDEVRKGEEIRVLSVEITES
ncbi:hypothetical protein DENIS_2307 [Desulfonema ishimotonii]|uniref:Baseplate protein J-like barrel domain-containing protein n=1 Tax=Desulfonema ishimotonii TaxID=45657 RepID=A0A401FWJ3_9BACT|nr:baseplate J/gp47 family protein [Desulfonema ishimotonii]GBC61347.1 hypothetical protein DENIS_2307 [Desulfonema ishimotonii]